MFLWTADNVSWVFEQSLKLGVNSKIPRNNTLNERLPFILTGIVGSSRSMDPTNAIIHLSYSFLCSTHRISCLETGNAFED